MLAIVSGILASLSVVGGVYVGYWYGRRQHRQAGVSLQGRQLWRDYETERIRRESLEALLNVLGYRVQYKGMNRDTNRARYRVAEAPHKMIRTRGGVEWSVN